MQSIGTLDLKSMFDQDEEFTLINTLSPDEFEKTNIPGSVNIPVEDDDFVEKVERLVDSKDDKIVVYCLGIGCESSKEAAMKLEGAGFEDVCHYIGGARAWRAVGGSLVSEK
jgi:rhodanese-related sulfurtransferase